VSHDADVHVEVDGHDTDHDGPWLPFFSLRFWTYLAAAFGSTGLLLSWLTDLPSAATLPWALATGLFVGLAVSVLMHQLRRMGADSSVGSSDFLGLEARVTAPIRAASMGRVRCSVKGEQMDVLATSDLDRDFEDGETVVIVEMIDGRARVLPREDVFG
jgi:membrane protein implicated in regulation of membrane protease activity